MTDSNGSKNDEQVTVIPDAWLDAHHAQQNKMSRYPIFLEIDRASEQQKSFKLKVRARLLFFSSGGYTKLFGTNKGVIAYATTGNTTRLQTMMRWTKEVSDELKMRKIAARFRFCSLSPSWEQDEGTLFLAPLWYRLFDKKPLPLLS